MDAFHFPTLSPFFFWAFWWWCVCGDYWQALSHVTLLKNVQIMLQTIDLYYQIYGMNFNMWFVFCWKSLIMSLLFFEDPKWTVHFRWCRFFFVQPSHIQQPTLWTKCNVQLMEISWNSPGFTKCWPRCLNLIVANASQLQGTYEAVTYACWHLPHPGFPISCSLNRCPFKWWCPVSGPISILSWLWLQLSTSQADFAEGLLRNSVGCFCPQVFCQCS
jgi:hypothetical protein